MNKKVEEYINKQELVQKDTLIKIRNLIKELIPEAEEKMSYGAPAFKLNGKLILYAAFKSHVGLYPEPEIIEKFKEELRDFETSKGTVKFKIDQPIPYWLIRKIILAKFID